ncbi:cellulase family glycosylhydrolase [Gracilibacillus marinus]|uniref:Cellulase family glycosylhydrolase n=1 Tax=Gracilibacillus marinus TaxID=630535 RepID=A0ABV8VPE0_9BACI
MSIFKSICTITFTIFTLLITTNITTSAETTSTIDINEYTQAMQPGWNLGNTYDAVGTDETAWGNPFVTKELIDTIASEGFNSIRIPITFDQRMSDAPDYTIDEDFLSRVEQTINWSLDAGMHVMINIHHDSWVWLESGMVNDHDATVARYEAIWTQLSQRFKDYPVELMFESINEPRFSTSDEESQQFINELNDIFYDVVRQSGGKNDIRPLVLPTHHTASDQGKLDALATYIEQLHDPNIIATVHYYGFWPFSVNIAGHTRFDQATKDEIHQVFDRVHDTFIKNGIPVVIGEFGLLGFDRHTGVIQQGEKLKFFEHMIHYAQEKELVHMLWDNGQHLDRNTLEWQDEELFSMMQTSWSTRSAHVHDNFIYLKQNNDISEHTIPITLNGTTFDKMVMNDTELTEGVDYTFAESTVTFTASFLSTIMNDNNTGIIETVTMHFSNGFTWDIDIISYTTPLLQDTTGRTMEFLIPTAFNGDQLATMEAYYADGSIAGPQNWTGFKEFDYTFSPNYENGTIRLQENFFKETEDGEIVLTFHFWSGEQITYYIEKSGDQVIGRATDQPIETPTKPSTPSEPSANDDNSVDKTAEDTNNNDSNPPSNTVTDDTSLNNEENGSTLPNTATSMFAYILIGLLVISIGFITMFIAKKRKISLE